MSDLSAEKFISFTTYRRSGEAVSTPTWIVPLDDGRYGFWTSSGTGKYKRLRATPRATVQPCDQRGHVKAGSVPVDVGVELVQSGARFDEIQRKVRAKYGFMTKLSRVFNALGHLRRRGDFPYADVGVVLTLPQA
ncbi:PPOX class F420-dependent oxidoreductase [Jatrophihabitans telluris]|uniref:PPOX class F420-dependent oxidoreductase n=1 Tax=Jatrophihabitans telluris TaxID=2038343 RepID=A0ABY4QZN5_9ACTN|nr:PPOX class F420-dependent oxidoreductase [Jatrophihabitans telluris]UQX88380.1 PPOX class F420-dependent oxidoreductase [Jatrophihabitans telluris]